MPGNLVELSCQRRTAAGLNPAKPHCYPARSGHAIIEAIIECEWLPESVENHMIRPGTGRWWDKLCIMQGQLHIGNFRDTNSTTTRMDEFGRHHLGLNVVIARAQDAMTPTLTGAQPSVCPENGKTIRVLAAENDKAFDLLNTLNEEQRKKAILNYQIGDLMLGPAHDGEVIVAEGLKAEMVTAKQKAMLTYLISQWAGIISDAYVKDRMKEIEADINETYFAWSGPTMHQLGNNGASYYRIQGPRVIIEFSPQGVAASSGHN